MTPTWHNLIHDNDQLRAMSADELHRAHSTAESYALAITSGISAVGNLLACAVLNDRMPPSNDVIADAAWLIKALSELSARLNDVQEGARDLLARRQQPEVPGKALAASARAGR